MDAYNFLLEKIILPIGDKVTKSSVMESLVQWRNITRLSEVEISELARHNLVELLEYASGHAPYYRALNIEKQADPYQWLKRFPIMNKHDIRNNIDQILTEPQQRLIKCVSSGSSGIQGITYMNEKERSVNRAIQILWWEWSGFYSGKKILQTGISPNRGWVKRLKDILFRTRYVTAFSQSESEIVEILNALKGQRGWHFGGYASSINVYATVAKAHKITDVHFDAVICWGDKVFDHFHKNVKEAFGCDIYETYGCSEGFLVGAKKDLPYYYIMSPHVYVEIVDDEGNEVPDGTMGHVLLTRLDAYSMPLIRYYVGDLAVKLPRESYPSTRAMGFPLLEKIVGRDTDIIKTQSGKYMIVHTFTGIFEHYPQIRQFRVIQRTIEEIEIEYIKGDNLDDKTLSDIQGKILGYLKEDFPIRWIEVDHIPPTPSGKPQIIQSFLKKQ